MSSLTPDSAIVLSSFAQISSSAVTTLVGWELSCDHDFMIEFREEVAVRRRKLDTVDLISVSRRRRWARRGEQWKTQGIRAQKMRCFRPMNDELVKF